MAEYFVNRNCICEFKFEDYTNRVNIPIKDIEEALEHDKD